MSCPMNNLTISAPGYRFLRTGNPDNAIVLCVDEKSQIQALERTQPLLPLGLGCTSRALPITTSGTGPRPCSRPWISPRARCSHSVGGAIGTRSSSSSYATSRQVPQDLAVHLIVDNYGTHKHAKVRRWLAARPRFQVHYTPTYASWLNQVEIWFSIITQRAIRRGTFRSVQDLVARIDQFICRSPPFRASRCSGPGSRAFL